MIINCSTSCRGGRRRSSGRGGRRIRRGRLIEETVVSDEQSSRSVSEIDLSIWLLVLLRFDLYSMVCKVNWASIEERNQMKL